ncbi:MAG: phosphotransferase, partial [Phycisphaerales bacterium]|nr:phosphotransferase [Phycisphaerales bacterium]
HQYHVARSMTPPPSNDHRSLAATLLPHLTEACDGRLHDVIWFKADWQRGGAATGRAKWKSDRGEPHDVIVKIPVGPRELTWLHRLQPEPGDLDDPVIPRLYASGTTLCGYDLGWVVFEKLSHGPLGMRWHKDHARRIADAAVRFWQSADRYVIQDEQVRVEHWAAMVDEARVSVRRNEPADSVRWLSLLKSLSSGIDGLVDRWRERDTDHWIHGDLHFANAMSRTGLQSGPVALIDLAEVRPGHWLEDAVFLERQLWALPDRLVTAKPVNAMASARRRAGLSVVDHWDELAHIRRALMAGTAPTFIRSEGHPRFFNACLNQLERSLVALRLRR